MKGFRIIRAAVLILISLTAVSAYQNEDQTRHLWDTAFSEKPKGGTPKKSAGKSRYRNTTPKVAVAGVNADTVIGVTIWRLRKSKSTDSGERIITHDDSSEWSPERVASGTRLNEGDRLRISIEAARTGYLYVIDREEFADGSLGEPVLIFPTSRTRGGDNRVQAGRLIEIPDQDDKPPFFTLKHTKANHVAENLTIIVSPQPIEALQITDRAQRLSEEHVAAWEKEWGGQSGRLEMVNGAGSQWTRAEKNAGLDRTRSLTNADPVPQTIYYRPGARSTNPVLVKMQLRYARRTGVRR